MLLPASLRAREPAAAARASVLVVVAAAVVTAWSAFLDPSNAGLVSQVGCWSVVAVLLASALTCRTGDPVRLDAHGVLLLVPTAGALAVNALNLLTRDTSAAAQVFLVLPVLLAATQLRARGAVLVTAVAIGGNAVVVALLQPVVDGLGDIVFVGAAMATVTAVLVQAEDRKERLMAALEAQASVDTLTGLVTRRVFDDALSHALATRADGAALVLVDVDGFKQVNDGHGHLAGDDALVHLAAVLRASIRTTDSVLGRIGGDELAVVLPGCTVETAVERAEELVRAVRAAPLTLVDGTMLALSVSVGVAQAAAAGTGLRELYAAADAALYEAKRGGRDQVSAGARL
ncbi:sensor domain-containing diguanylate cyclase [Modestobacter sp. Leaf380]|uniref:GGDEF domain-containing protein n=1 Tax=Modestobacter sp. Leaf380 TaxID=1736356 RepID=UPI0006F25008|nr:sensor domain-containing diguanylate cyclase [Modestobacter sp. Leaf380]KQS68898.1 hypothetical protein ASG41_08345 [Modestobacter sp. Leaf380]